MNEYTYTDFLVKKSIQPFSLRNLQGAVNQFQNLTLHINKKAFEIRQQSKDQLNTMEIIRSKKLQVQTLPDTDRHLKQIMHAKQLNWRNLLKDSEHKKIMQLMNKDKYVDDVVVVSEGQKKSNKVTDYQIQLQKLKSEKAIWTVENKLKFVMDDKIKFNQIKKLHKQFVTEKLKKNFWEQRFNSDEQSSSAYKSINKSVQSDSSNRNVNEKIQNDQYSKSKKKQKNFKIDEVLDQDDIKEQYNNNDADNYELQTSRSQIKNGSERKVKVKEQPKSSSGIEQNYILREKDQTATKKQTLQHFLEIDQNILPSKIQSNLTTQPNSQKYLKEIKTEQKKQGKSLNSSCIQVDQKFEPDEYKIIKSNSIHAHFEADFDKQASYLGANSNQLDTNKLNYSKLEENMLQYSKTDQMLNIPSLQKNHKSIANINPFDSEIFIQQEEFDNEKYLPDFNPGEKYEQLRKINSESEKRLIDYVIKKNKFELVDLFPTNVKIQRRKYVDFDQIQLSDFNKTEFYKQTMEKEKQKNTQNQPNQNQNKLNNNNNNNKQIDEENKQQNRQSTPQQNEYFSSQKSDRVIKNKNQDLIQKQSPIKKRKVSKNKIKSQCIQRLSKDTDQFSIQYLRKYGLEETINLKDEFSKLRSTATTFPYSLKTDASKQNSLCASPRNNPYLLNNKEQIFHLGWNRKNLTKSANKNQIQINDSNTTGLSNTLYGGGFLSSRSENRRRDKLNQPQSQTNSKQQNEISPFFIKKPQLSISQALKSEEAFSSSQNPQSFNLIFSPINKNTNKNNDQKNNEFCQKQSVTKDVQTNKRDISENSKQKNNQNQMNKLLKFQKMIQEKQKNIQENLQTKENFIKFYDNVLTQSKQQSKNTGTLNKEIKKIVKSVDKSLASIQSSKGPKLSTFHHEFRDFKEMKIFKRKLFNFAINKIHPDDRKGLFELYSMTHRQEVEDLFAQQMKK